MTVANLPPSKRLPRIDMVRGLALVAMASYHFTWDLRLYDLIDTDPVTSAPLMWYARGIAASFLTLVGVSLVLANRDGLRPQPFLKRLALVAGGAILVTIGTWFAFPDSFVFFGILHHIAVASLLALPFLRAPVWLVILAAIFAFTAPLFLMSNAMSHPALIWLGLSPITPRTNDFVPLFPWFGWVLLGLAAGRVLSASQTALNVFAPPPHTAAGRGLNYLGRHSLMFYLVHQPILIGFVWLIVQSDVVAPRSEPAEEFLPACEDSCRATGENPALCARVCGCVVDRLKGTAILAPRRGGLSLREEDQLGQAVAACRVPD